MLSLFLSNNFHNKNKLSSSLIVIFLIPVQLLQHVKRKKEPSKRKLTDKGILFSEKWADDYFFVEANSKALCLLCREFVQVFKD